MLKIRDESSTRRGFHFEKSINLLLTFIPAEHLIGLGEIVLLDKPVDKWRKERLKNARAAHYPGHGARAASIHLYADRIFDGVLPWFFFIPNAAAQKMAWSLFHEVGHHRNQTLPGIAKARQEVSANAYAAERYEEFDRYYAAPIRRALLSPLMKLYNFVLSRTEPHKSAFGRLRAAVREKPGDVSALLDLAHQHYHFWNLRSSERLFRKALRLGAAKGHVYYELACIEWNRRNWAKSADLFELAATHGTEKRSVRHWLAKTRSRAAHQ